MKQSSAKAKKEYEAADRRIAALFEEIRAAMKESPTDNEDDKAS